MQFFPAENSWGAGGKVVEEGNVVIRKDWGGYI